jgi:lincosamide nucleotidyltransferase A/C/D/E
MDASHLLHLLGTLNQAGVTVWLDGGWGVDALLQQEMREHDDVDVVTDLALTDRLTETLAGEGYEVVVGSPPTSFVLVDSLGRQVDVHPVTFDNAGNGLYLMENGKTWVYPAEGFTGHGEVGGQPVRCLSAAVQVSVHDGYDLGEKDYAELRLLHERFGVPLPAKFTARVLGTDL